MSFLGQGVRFPLATTPIADASAGPLVMSSDEQKIVESIWLILTTAPGERVMRSDFGCALDRIVFSSLSDATLGQAINAVKVALTRWEPRITVVSVDAQPSSDDPGLLLIDIEYVVRQSNSRYNLVYPFYLR